MDDYTVCDSGFKSLDNTGGSPFETYPSGIVRGLPRILSENSIDVRTRFYFSPLLHDCTARNRVLGRLIHQSFPSPVPVV